MLHKKSEYMIQYNKLNEELRRKIWQDNIALRKSRLLSNQATHYWEYQLTDEICDCENGGEEEGGGPLPLHRQKHLPEKCSHKAEKIQILPLNVTQRDAREMAVQTPEWNGEEPNNRVDDTSEEELMRNASSLTLTEGNNHSRPPSPIPPMQTPTPLPRPRTAASITRPSRTSRKLHSETKRTHFAPFGWNETKTNVGHKQTYNVCAPQKEVHDSALHASQRRKAEMDQYYAQENRLKHQTRSRKRTSSNPSSIWMSEYQEQFTVKGSKGLSHNSRPLSAPPVPRQSVSWRHS